MSVMNDTSIAPKASASADGGSAAFSDQDTTSYSILLQEGGAVLKDFWDDSRREQKHKTKSSNRRQQPTQDAASDGTPQASPHGTPQASPQAARHGTPMASHRGIDIYLHTMKSPVGNSRHLGNDRGILENRSLSIPILIPQESSRRSGRPAAQEDSETAADGHQHDSTRAILLLHGLNERSWNKYYPWAHRIASLTGRPVILFPTAFHIDRSPSEWQDIREMSPQVKARRMLAKILKKSVIGLSFANVALSSRIEEAPERFIRAGFQTMLDIEKFAGQVRKGKLPQISENSSFDFFCYSIGCSLGQSLLMSDLSKPEKKRLFTDSRQVFFCGGALLEYANPISKLILDEESYRVLNAYFYALAHDDASALKRVKGRKLKKFDRLQSMAAILYGDAKKSYREEKLKKIGERSLVISMAGDSVFPPEAVRRTWSSQDAADSVVSGVSAGPADSVVSGDSEGLADSKSPYITQDHITQEKTSAAPLTEIRTYIPPTATSHENPFPRERSPEKRSLVDAAFDTLFTSIASWYGSWENDSE